MQATVYCGAPAGITPRTKRKRRSRRWRSRRPLRARHSLSITLTIEVWPACAAA